MADLFQDILKTFERLGLWEDGVELIGSWSFFLYQRHLGVRPHPLRTQDIDFLLPRPYPRRTKANLAEAFSKIGFQVDFTGQGAVYFIHPELKLEFLTPERGRGDDSPKQIKSLGIKVVQLRFLDMLFENPIIVKEGGTKVRIPNPMSFCLHKLIIGQRRQKAHKAEKDIEQATVVLSILDPKKFRAAFNSHPKKWRLLISKSLKKAWDLFPLERPVLEKFNITLHI